MPFIGFGQELAKSSGNYIRLKTVGDSLKYRILGEAYVEGNHFFFADSKWDIQPCPRINAGSDCPHCDKFFKALKSIPKIEDKKEYRDAVDEMKKSVPGCEPAITYNFPVINRDTEAFTVFKATPGIRAKIENEAAIGTKVLEVDFITKNTGKPGKDKYAFSRVDSADTAPLTEKEKIVKTEYTPAKLEAEVIGAPDEDSAVAFEANSEIRKDEVNASDIPF
jgi:hypothetical protein